MTTIEDSLTYADGRPVNGRVVVSWPSFQVNAVNIAGGMQTFDIVNGVFHVELQSNNNSKPLGMYYTAVFELEEGALYTEYWIIPDQPLVTLGQVRIGFPVTPSALISAAQLTSAGATYGQFLGWDGTHWVPMYVSFINLSPNYIALNLTAGVAANLSISGSPATLGQSMTLNVPDAGPASRGVITSGPQTLGGQKTFQGHAFFEDGITVGGISTFPPGYVVPQTPWAQDINAAGFRLTNAGSIGINHTLLPIPAPVAEPVLVVGPSLGDGIARIIVCGNTGGGALGAISFANSTIGAPDKRVAQITAFLDGSTNSAAMLFLTSAGIGMIERMRITSAGLVGIGKTPLTYRVEVAGDLDVTGVYRVNGVPTVSGVASVFGRVGAVVAQTGDYVVAQVTGAVPNTRQVVAGPGMTGGGALSADVTLAANVLSVFGRTGLVVATTGDYTAAQVTNAVSALGSYADPLWITSLAWAKITGAPVFALASRQIIAGAGLTGGGPMSADVTLAANMLSVFGRIGAVVAQTGDYTAAQVTNAVSVLGSYADPAWITSLAWSKLTGVPALVPEFRRVNAGVGLTGGGTLAADVTLHAAPMGASGGSSAAGMAPDPGKTPGAARYLCENATWDIPAGGGGGSQTPWLSNIDAANYTLSNVQSLENVGNIGVNGPSSGGFGVFVWRRNFGFHHEQTVAAGTASLSLTNDLVHEMRLWMTGSAFLPTPDICRFEVAGAPLAIFTGNAERMRIDAAGNVGIGHTLATLPAPVTPPVLVVGPSLTDGVSRVIVCGNATSGGLGVLSFANSAITAADKRVAQITIFLDGSTSSAAMVFLTSAGVGMIERMRITSAGDVGIGTSNIGARLQILTSAVGATAAAFCGGAPNIYLCPVAGAPNPGANAAQTDAAILALATASGHFGLVQGDLLIATQTRVGTAGGNRVVFGHPADNTGGYTYGMMYDRGKLDCVGMIRSLGLGTIPTTGAGVELYWTGTSGGINCYDRVAAAFRGLNVSGNPLLLNANGFNVGVGVAGAPIANSALHVAKDTTRQLYLTLSSDPVNKQMRIGYDATNNTCVVEGSLNGAGVQLLLNPAGGPVGIGTPFAYSKLSFGGTDVGFESRIAFFEGAGSVNFRGIGMTNPAPSVWGVGTWASTAAAPTNNNMAMFVRDGGYVGIAKDVPIARLHTFGTGQVAGTFETVSPVAGVFPEMIYVQQADGAAGSGGGVLFGWPQGPFAAIKAYVQNGAGNSVGSLRFYTRATVADTFLSCRMAIEATYTAVTGDMTVTGGLSAGTAVWSGGELRVGIINSTDYMWFRHGGDGYLYCTGSQVGYSGFVLRVDAGREVIRVANTGNVSIIPSTSRVGAVQGDNFAICESSNAGAGYRLKLGFYNDGQFWYGSMQCMDGGAGGNLSLNPQGGFVSVGSEFRAQSPLHIRNNTRSGDPALGIALQAGGQFRIQTNDVGVDFGFYGNGETWMQAYNGISALSAVYAIAINPRGGPVGLGKKHTFTSLLAIGALPGASTGVPGDIWRDGSGFLRQV